MQRLFVYGTLAPGRENFAVVEFINGQWEVAAVRGKLVHTGWGAESGYPGLIPTPSGSRVEGYLFTSTELEQHWNRLDEFEGADYVRSKIVVERNNGEIVEADVYILNTGVSPMTTHT